MENKEEARLVDGIVPELIVSLDKIEPLIKRPSDKIEKESRRLERPMLRRKVFVSLAVLD